jgi:hypothetical protein
MIHVCLDIPVLERGKGNKSAWEVTERKREKLFLLVREMSLKEIVKNTFQDSSHFVRKFFNFPLYY